MATIDLDGELWAQLFRAGYIVEVHVERDDGQPVSDEDVRKVRAHVIGWAVDADDKARGAS